MGRQIRYKVTVNQRSVFGPTEAIARRPIVNPTEAFSVQPKQCSKGHYPASPHPNPSRKRKSERKRKIMKRILGMINRKEEKKEEEEER